MLPLEALVDCGIEMLPVMPDSDVMSMLLPMAAAPN